MDRILDDRYTFAFLPAEGGPYQRQCYWEVLHTFLPPQTQPILAAIRVLPHSGIHQALYETLKGEKARSIPRELFYGTPETYLQVTSDDNHLIHRVEEILPDQTAAMSLEILEETEERLEEATGQVLADFGIENGLRQLGQPGGADEIERRFSDPTDVFHTLADVKSEDVGWVSLSYHIDAAVKNQIRESLQTGATRHALTLHTDIEDGIYAKLYSNLDYLAFVKRVLDAKGEYVSPVVRNFISFYLKCLEKKIQVHAQNTNTDSHVLRKKLETLLGNEKGAGHYTLNYHDVTLIGHLIGGELPRDERDPDSSHSSYKVDPDVDTGPLFFQEVEGTIPRFLIQKFAEHTFSVHHNIRSIQYIGEDEQNRPGFETPPPA